VSKLPRGVGQVAKHTAGPLRRARSMANHRPKKGARGRPKLAKKARVSLAKVGQ